MNKKLLDQPYLNLKDIQEYLGIGRKRALKIYEEVNKVTKEKNYYIPDGWEKLVNTQVFLEVLGLKK